MVVPSATPAYRVTNEPKRRKMISREYLQPR